MTKGSTVSRSNFVVCCSHCPLWISATHDEIAYALFWQVQYSSILVTVLRHKNVLRTGKVVKPTEDLELTCFELLTYVGLSWSLLIQFSSDCDTQVLEWISFVLCEAVEGKHFLVENDSKASLWVIICFMWVFFVSVLFHLGVYIWSCGKNKMNFSEKVIKVTK